MTSRSRAALGAAFLALLALPARAETRAEEDVTPLALVRRAEVVAVVRGVAAPAGGLRVEEALRGQAAVGEVLVAALRPEADDLRVVPGLRSVAFLRRLPEGRCEVLGGALGLVAVEEPPPGAPEPAALALVRVLAEEARPAGGLASPGRARAALVAVATGGDGVLRSGAALDLFREPGLLAGVTETERTALVEAFRTAENRSRARYHLVRIVGILRPEGAARMLADALLAPGGAAIRPAVGQALADLGDPAAVAHFAARTADASAPARALLAGALGGSGLAEARAPLEALLGAAEPAVRTEAVVALGRLRTAAAAPALLRRFGGEAGGAAPEADEGVRRALAWALAQCDEPEAWRTLEAAAAPEGGSTESFRAFVRSVLENPRRSFVR